MLLRWLLFLLIPCFATMSHCSTDADDAGLARAASDIATDRPDAPGEDEGFDPVDVTPRWLNFKPVDVRVEGDHAFFTAGDGLHIFDITDPSYPVRIKFVEAPGSWGGLEVTGGYAYVPSGIDCFRIIDIDPIDSAHVVGSVELPEAARLVAVSGDRAYVTCGNPVGGTSGNVVDSLQVIDISDSESPRVLGSVATASSARRVAAAGDYAYVATDSAIEIFRIDRSGSPELVRTVSVQSVEDFRLSGGYGYVAYYRGLIVVDLRSIESEPAQYAFEIPESSYSLAVRNDRLCITGTESDENGRWYNCLKVVNIENPESPAVEGSFVLPCYPRGAIEVADDRAYIVDMYTGLRIIDIGYPPYMTILGTCPTTGSSMRAAVAGDYAYLAKYSGLAIVDIREPENAQLAGSVEIPGEVVDVTAEGEYAYALAQSSLEIVHVAAPKRAHIEKSVEIPLWPETPVTMAGGYAYITYQSGLIVVDVDPPDSAHVLQGVNMPPNISRVFVAGEYAFASTRDQETQESRLLALRINLPESLDIVASLDRPWTVIGVDESGEFGFVSDIRYWEDPCWQVGRPDANYFIGTIKIDPTARDSIWNLAEAERHDEDSILASIDFSGFPKAIPIVGGYAYVLGSGPYVVGQGTDLNIIDLDPPESMHLAGTFSLDLMGFSDIEVSVGYAYIVGGDGLLIYKLR